MTTTGVNYLWSFIRKVSHLRARGQQVIPLTFVGLLDCIQVPDMNNLEAGGACHELWAAIVIRGGPGNDIIYTTCSTLTGHFFYLHGVNISRVIVKCNRNNNNIFVKTNLLMLQNCVASVLGVAFLALTSNINHWEGDHNLTTRGTGNRHRHVLPYPGPWKCVQFWVCLLIKKRVIGIDVVCIVFSS